MSFPKSENFKSLITCDLNNLIPGTELSLQKLINSLNSSININGLLKNNKIKLIKVIPIDGQGLMSNTFKICILFENENNNEFNLILKITTTKKLEKFRPGEIKAFNENNSFDKVLNILFELCQAEANFYELVLPHFLNDKEFCKILPKLYSIKRSPNKIQIEKGFILIEDMSNKGKSPNIYEGLNNEQIISSILQLAKFHASSINLSPKIMECFNLKYYGDLIGLEEDIFNRILNIGSTYFLCHQKILFAFLKKHNKLLTNLHNKYNIPPILCHGDFWANNLFFSKNKKLSAILDWQTPHINTGLNDIIRLIFTGVNYKLRKQKLWEWLNLYFDTLQNESKKLGILFNYSKELRKLLYSEQVPTIEKLDGEIKYDTKGREELIEWIDHVHKSECRFYNEVFN
ncbi:RING-type domain-containing protein [Meloidogyne graminicola]|uniref:RING-type domain-containing protein n=1 Tax=Meloidogyne graminicola TaxID=189291 RepID=A0A8T0A0T8_9BILA|nr:RING-type domain-containing protein [Meloidogyne graminicola]